MATHHPTPPAIDSARAAGLRHVDDGRLPGIRRVGAKSRVRYVGPQGRTIADEHELRRIRALAIPPAWTDVWICPDPRGHVQATGRDARGRKQYRYHPRWREVRDEAKYGRLLAFAQALPAHPRANRRGPASIRPAAREGPRRRRPAAREDAHPHRQRGIRARQRLVRPDDDARPARDGRRRHACTSSFAARAAWRTPSISTTRGSRRIVKACRDLPGHELFQYVDERRRPDRRSTPPTSTPTCARSAARTSPPRTSAPGPARCWPPARWRSAARLQSAAEAKRNVIAADRFGRATAGQHQGGLPQVLHPSRRSSRPTWTASPSSGHARALPWPPRVERH